MSKIVCEYCSSEFTTKGNLNRHQKRAKYCLELQGEEREELLCSCGKSFSRGDVLLRHKRGCSPGQNQAPPQPVVTVTESVLLELIKKSGNNNNTINNTINMQPITNNYLESEGNKYLTEEVVKKGTYPELAGKVLDGYVICTDKARKKLKYKDAEGQLSDNSHALMKALFTAISPKNNEIGEEAYGELQRLVQEIASKGQAGDIDITGMLAEATAIQDNMFNVNNAAEGNEDNGLTEQTIKHLALMLR